MGQIDIETCHRLAEHHLICSLQFYIINHQYFNLKLVLTKIHYGTFYLLLYIYFYFSAICSHHSHQGCCGSLDKSFSLWRSWSSSFCLFLIDWERNFCYLVILVNHCEKARKLSLWRLHPSSSLKLEFGGRDTYSEG